MADDKKKLIEVKSIDSSDLSPEELAKAIDSTTNNLLKTVKVDVKATDTKSQPDELKVPTHVQVKDNLPTADETSQADKGGSTGVIVENRSYVRDSDKKVKLANDTDEDKPTGLKPPSKTQKVVAQPDNKNVEDKKPDNDNKVSVTTTTDDQTTDKPEASGDLTIQATPAEVTTKPPESIPQKSNISVPAVSDQVQNMPNDSIKTLIQNKTEEVQPVEMRQPAIYDTDQYHLPIKTRSKKYMNGVLAWTILTLFIVGIGGYVLTKLEVIDITSLGF